MGWIGAGHREYPYEEISYRTILLLLPVHGNKIFKGRNAATRGAPSGRSVTKKILADFTLP
jgi:hypothetical protein